MTAQNTPFHVAHSVEPTRLTYLLRRSLVGGVVLTIAIAGLVMSGALVIPGTGAVESSDALGRGVQVSPDPLQVPEVGPDQSAGAPPPTGEATAQPPAQIEPPTDTPAEAQPPPAASGSPALPDRSSSFVAQSPQRVLDTRDDDPSTSETVYRIDVPADRTAVALSISLIGSTQPGAVVVDGGAGSVNALAVAGPGVSATNLVIVPVIGQQAAVRSSAGGYLTVDVVGAFQPSTGSSAGRFVPVDPTEVARLKTSVDGRETDVALNEALPAGATAALVVIDADVGADGGMVRLGPAAAQFDQMLMWGAATDENVQRRGLVLITPSDIGAAYLRYDGGTLLTVNVVGYFTGDDAEPSTDGLYVPSGPRQLFDGPIADGQTVEVGAIEPGTGTALISVNSSAAPGQVGSIVVPVNDGTLALTTGISEAIQATLLGVFIAGQ